MGDPIKVGDSFYDYEKLKYSTIADYCQRRGGNRYTDIRVLGPGKMDIFNLTRDNNGVTYAQGRKYGNNAEIYSDWGDGNYSIYSTEYKPEVQNQNKDKDKVYFTTIYDWRYNRSTGETFYYKAIDKNDNNIIDEGEITKYKNEDELFGGN